MEHEKSFVYCNTCLAETVVNIDTDFQCKNPKCPAPYIFRTHRTKDAAYKQFKEEPSWIAKYYFHPQSSCGERIENIWCVAWYNERVYPFIPTNITDLIEADALRLMQRGLAQQVEGSVAILDANGDRIEDYEDALPVKCSSFCKYLRNLRNEDFDGNKKCQEWDEDVFRRIVGQKHLRNLIEKLSRSDNNRSFDAYAYKCWANMVDFACPIIVEGKVLAVLFTGQQRTKDTTTEFENGPYFIKAADTSVEKDFDIEKLLCNSILFSNDEISSTFEKLGQAINRIYDIAFERYTRKREVQEYYFREEVTHILSTEKESISGVTETHKVLNRLLSFLGITEVYFLLNDICQLNRFEILSKGSSEKHTECERKLSIELGPSLIDYIDRITIVEITANSAFSPLLDQLREQLSINSFKKVWLGTCPLPGATRGLWLFFDPIAEDGRRQMSSFTHLDLHFLNRFCEKVRSVLASNFATSLVMRNLSHELGAGISNIIKRENEIKLGKIDMETAISHATRNICQLRRYEHLIANVRYIFARRGRDNYVFRKQDISLPLLSAVCAFDGDAGVDSRKIELRQPRLYGDTMLEFDHEMMEMVFFNLVHNAVKYSFDDHYIEIVGRQILR